MYENDSAADLYDMLYRDRKDYRAEAELVTELVRMRNGDAATLLDMACGTGLHLEAFADLFGRVEGADLSEHMISVAQRRLPEVPLHLVDMRDFHLGSQFDAIVCLFSSIAYLRSTDDLNRAMSSMAGHLTPRGSLVIEPWYFPETFRDGWASAHALTTEGRAITRVSHSTRENGSTRMEIHYVVAESGTGVRHRSEVDYLTLFSRYDYETAFRQAGLACEYVVAPDSRPGYFVGTRA